MHNKLIWVDNLKVLGIFAVILGHIASPLGGFIFSWHMPLFFMIAGFFIRFDLLFKDFIIKDFKRLMMPYFVFANIGFVVEILKRLVLHRVELNYVNELQGIFIWMDMSSLVNTYASVLWFLPALFFTKAVLYIIHKNIHNLFYQLIVISILFGVSFLVDLPFGIDNAFNALLFLFIGNIFFTYYQDNKLLHLLPFIVLGLYFFIGFPDLDMARKSYYNIFINLFFSISLVYTFITILKKINIDNKLFKLWGGSTMLLFIIHPYTNNIAHMIVEKLQFGDWYLKFFISLILLQCLLFINIRFKNRGIFKYV